MVNQLINAYLELDEFKDAVRDQLVAHDSEYIRAINAASRQIDDYCGRYFYQTTLQAKAFKTDQVDLLLPSSDISTTTGLIVKIDNDGDGVYETTWTLGTHFQLGPMDRNDGVLPYETVEALPIASFPVDGINVIPNTVGGGSYRRKSRLRRVQITAQWGFPTIPENVKMGCVIAAVDHFKAKDLTHVTATYGIDVRIARDATPGNFGRSIKFNRLRAPSMNPEVEALVSSFRKTVIA